MKNLLILSLVLFLGACEKIGDTINSQQQNKQQSAPPAPANPPAPTPAPAPTPTPVIKPEPDPAPAVVVLTQEDINNNINKAIEDNDESLLNNIEKKHITAQVAKKAIEKNNLSCSRVKYF